MPVLHTQTASLNVFVNTGDFTVYNSLTLLTGSFVLPKSFIHGTFIRLNDNALVTGGGPGITTVPGWPLNNSAFGHHVEGYRTQIPLFNTLTGLNVSRSVIRANHAEGYQTSVDYWASHVEGLRNTIIYGSHARAEGMGNTLVGNYNYINGNLRPGGHVEGSGSSIGLNPYGHAEGAGHNTAPGNFTFSSQGQAMHVEGFRNSTGGGTGNYWSHIEGAFNILDRPYRAHIEGMNNIARGQYNGHIEGFNNSVAVFNNIRGYHIEGQDNQLTTTNLGDQSTHIQGYKNICAPPGYQNLSINQAGVETRVGMSYTHTLGYKTTASNTGFAGGYGTVTVEPTVVTGYYNNYIIGHFNTSSYYQSVPATPVTSSVTYFAVGGGKSNSQRADIFVAYAQRRTSVSAPANTPRQILLPGVLNSGPYANDIAAAAGGVPIGGIYRLSDGIQNNLLQIRLS
jgi:hypothetical protein